MKYIGLFSVVVLAFGLGAATQSSASSLIVNGSFESPSVNGSYAMISNGGVPGWTTTDPGGLIEIDDPSVFGGGSTAYAGTQSLEVDADNPEDVMQTVTGLTVGQTYLLSWAYGDRPGSGPQEMQVYFGGNLVTTDYDTSLQDNNSTLVWSPQSFLLTATGTSAVLSFDGVYAGGLESYGNEVDAVSLVPAPEPSTLLLFVTGLGLLGYALRRQRGLELFRVTRTSLRIP
jgi:PEP-CTERM motif-containing protein